MGKAPLDVHPDPKKQSRFPLPERSAALLCYFPFLSRRHYWQSTCFIPRQRWRQTCTRERFSRSLWPSNGSGGMQRREKGSWQHTRPTPRQPRRSRSLNWIDMALHSIVWHSESLFFRKVQVSPSACSWHCFLRSGTGLRMRPGPDEETRLSPIMREPVAPAEENRQAPGASDHRIRNQACEHPCVAWQQPKGG